MLLSESFNLLADDEVLGRFLKFNLLLYTLLLDVVSPIRIGRADKDLLSVLLDALKLTSNSVLCLLLTLLFG